MIAAVMMVDVCLWCGYGVAFGFFLFISSHSEFDIILREYIHFINIPVVGFILMVTNIKYENAIQSGC